jgi:hypothetical protein
MAKTAGTSVIRWEDQLAADATIAAAVEQGVGVGNFISIRGGIMSYAGAPMPNNEMNCIIVEHLMTKAYYEGKFDPDNRASPVCYAYGQPNPDGTMPDMVPHADSEKKQGDACDGCRWNAFKTADNGKGKACKDQRRIALVHADSLKNPAGLAKAPIAFAMVPVTSVAGWAQYVRGLREVAKRPPYAVITRLKVVQDPKVQFRMTFDLVDKITDPKLLGPLRDLHLRMQKEITFPYPANEEKPAGGKKKPAANKFAKPKKK